jgi:serine protease
VAVAAGLVVGVLIASSTAPAGAGPPGPGTVSDPVAGHPYRHGAVPIHGQRVGAGSHAGVKPTSVGGKAATPGRATKGPVRSGGGSVLTGPPSVYLVFWGDNWGSASTFGGNDVFSGDPDGLAPNLQDFFRGLGTNNEAWSAIVTQYCQGVSSGATTCSTSPPSAHVAYPSGTVLAVGGVWNDASVHWATGPRGNSNTPGATGTQIAQEAANAAIHFGNPAGAQYVIVSPNGANPDGWLDPISGYCAYHDDSQDPFLGGVSGPDVPYTNLPYVPEVGPACSSMPAPGLLDGADETASHEYAEMLTDPFPSSGWVDRTGLEVADKCQNLVGGTPGGATDLTLSTGTFVVQGLWANDLGKRGGCENAHSFVLTVDPGKQASPRGVPVSLAIVASDVRGLPLTFSATGLPAGLTVDPTSGLISGVPTGRGRTPTTVVASDGSSSSSVSFRWTVGR